MSGLFRIGEFYLSSGQISTWKIDCDALTEEDWRGLAIIGLRVLRSRSFSDVIGIETGGLKFAAAIEHVIGGHTRARHLAWPRLIVDDVLTTGRSMLARMTQESDVGLVAFARGEILDTRISAIFTTDPRL